MDEFVERRRFKRFSLYCPLQYRTEDGHPRKTSLSINISENGAMISSDRLVDIGSGLIVRLFMGKKEFFLRSRIVHVQPQTEEGPYNIGLEFFEKASDFILRFYEEIEGITRYRKLVSEELGREASLAEASMRWYRNSPAWLT